MATISIEAQTRDKASQGGLNLMRREGWIPAVLYGGSKGKEDNVSLKLDGKTFLKTIAGHSTSSLILELKWEGQSANVLINEIQKEHLSSRPIHIDFHRVVMTKKLEVQVPIHLDGEAVGVKMSGGILEHITRDVRVSCLPKDIPERIHMDISALEIGQGLTVKDLKAPPGVEILSDPGQLVANVVAPTILEEVAPAAAAPGAAEPEVIAKGKKPEEGEAAEGQAAPAAAGKGGAAQASPSPKPGSPPPAK